MTSVDTRLIPKNYTQQPKSCLQTYFDIYFLFHWKLVLIIHLVYFRCHNNQVSSFLPSFFLPFFRRISRKTCCLIFYNFGWEKKVDIIIAEKLQCSDRQKICVEFRQKYPCCCLFQFKNWILKSIQYFVFRFGIQTIKLIFFSAPIMILTRCTNLKNSLTQFFFKSI